MMSNSRNLALTVCLCAAAAALPAKADNLLVNPGFEHPDNAFLNFLMPGGYTWISGWTTTGTGVHWMRESLGYFTDSVGRDAVDLANYTYANGGIKQSFATQAGAKYLVEFYGMTFQNAGNDGTGEITALIDNAVIDTYQLVNHSSSSNAWQRFSFNFIANGTSTTLEFRNTLAAGKQYSFLDNVSVTTAPVPEPETYALMLAGLGLLGWKLRSRRA